MGDLDRNGLPLLVKPFRPLTGGWVAWPANWPADRRAPYVIERYYSRGQELQVLTAIEVVEQDGLGSPMRPEYHVSVSGLRWLADKPYRVSESRARWALKQFGFDGYVEDNHAPHGVVRNYWRPVADQFAGQVCACVAEEPAVHEMRGDYVWRG